jgi:L-alanine-DL-glutamate epimerase-like enolase superfamily enzyme
MTTPTTIVELRSTLLQVPWRGKPPAAGILSAPFRDIYVLEIETQGGLLGMSYLMPLRGGLHTLDACMKELIAPHVIGRDATEIEAIWQTLYKSNFWLGRMGVTVFAQSAVDMALWREDVQNVKAMREAMGGGIEIMIDVNMGWDADTAIQAGHRIDEFDPYWLEEPVVAEDFAGYRRIAAALKTRIVGGESHFTRNDLRPFFETPCVPILQPDPMRGGYSELRKIAAAAEPWGIRLAPHLFHETMVHVLAAIPNASYLEYMDWNDDLWIEPVLPSKDGTMSPPERPGHGLAFRPEILKDFRKGGQRLKG